MAETNADNLHAVLIRLKIVTHKYFSIAFKILDVFLSLKFASIQYQELIQNYITKR